MFKEADKYIKDGKQSYLDKLWEEMSLEEKQTAYAMYRDAETLSDNFFRMERLIYKKRPPTPEQLLDPNYKWLNRAFINSLYDHVKEDFIEITRKDNPYNQVVQYGATRNGKSFTARLLIFYTIVLMHHIREPQLFYNLSPATSLTLYLLAFKYEKTKQLLLKPIFNFIEQSPRFIKTTFQNQVKPKQEEVGMDYIVYSTAATVGEITLASGLQLVCGNDDPLSIIGADILQMYVSEIAFFIETAGATEEEIKRLYTDGLDRIKATVGRQHMCFMYLDTSANNADSLIENYILKELSNRPDVFYRSRSRWDARPYLYSKWQETGETFKVISGNGSIPAQIVTQNAQLEDVPKHLIIEVPIDLEEEFELNLIKSIKDIAGRPTSAENKFIQQGSLISNIFDNPSLQNVEGCIVADSGSKPENLIWSQISDKFFVKYDGTNHIIRRAQREPRWISLDLATSVKGDVVGITMLHKEMSKEKNEIVYVADFSFAIVPGENGINLQAIEEFIKDLALIGNVVINKVSADKFQSDMILQNLTRMGFETEKLSVDTSLEPYMFFYGCMITETFKAGRNIFMKNNIDSLHRVKDKNGKKEKIDHTAGKTMNKYLGDFDNSLCGINAKDVSDSAAACAFMAKNVEHLPLCCYEDENKKFELKCGNNKNNNIFDSTNKVDLLDYYKKLHRRF